MNEVEKYLVILLSLLFSDGYSYRDKIRSPSLIAYEAWGCVFVSMLTDQQQQRSKTGFCC